MYYSLKSKILFSVHIFSNSIRYIVFCMEISKHIASSRQ